MIVTHDFGSRAIAFLIDSLIVGVGVSILTTIFGALRGFPGGFVDVFRIGTDDWWSVIVFAAYYIVFAVTKEGRTFGKLAMNLVVRYDDETKMSQNDLIVRELIKAALMPIAFISMLFVVFRDDNKAIHDLIHDTMVYVNKNQTQESVHDAMRRPNNTTRDDFYE